MVSENIRVRFEKTGKLIFISHLDLCRTMRTMLKRAKLPVKYTEGFNPHLKMVFALPLSVGAESVCELMDLTLTRPVDCEEAMARLSAAFPPELRVTAVYPVERKLQEVAFAEYDLTILGKQEAERIRTLFSAPVLVEKRAKNGEMHDIDLCDSIGKWDVREEDGNTVLHVFLKCLHGGSLNPEYLMKACAAEDYRVKRLCLYGEDMTQPFV